NSSAVGRSPRCQHWLISRMTCATRGSGPGGPFELVAGADATVTALESSEGEPIITRLSRLGSGGRGQRLLEPGQLPGDFPQDAPHAVLVQAAVGRDLGHRQALAPERQ